MRIAVNCRSFLKRKYTGIGRYAYNLVRNLSEIDQENQYLLYVRKGIFDFNRNLPRFSAKNFSAKYDFFNRGLEKTLGDVDIYHSPSLDFIDIDCPRIVVTVHDLVYKTFPSGHTKDTIETTQKQFDIILNKASKIICCSKSTMEDLQRYFQVPDDQACMVHQGVNKNIFRKLEEDETNVARETIHSKGISEPYILFVGTNEPRKNLENLICALSSLKQDKRFVGKLVVIGMKGWLSDDIEQLIGRLSLKDDVIFLGYISDNELCHFYNLAEVFVFPSFYEGFGFPIVEAFSCGSAVVTSNVSSCAEIASDAALTVDPYDAGKIADGIARIIEDNNFKEELKKKALKRADDFSFLKTAQDTLKIYREVYSKT